MKKWILILLFCSAAPAGIFINSFNSGKLSKDLKVRADLERHTMGSETLTNILIRPQGMAYKRPGTEYIGSAYGKFTAEIPEVPAVRIRDEATIVTNNNFLLFYDEDYVLIESMPTPTATTTLDIGDDGLVYVGTTGGIWVVDTDRNVDANFFVPTLGWPAGSTVLSVKVTDDDQYVWASNIRVGLDIDFFCFDRVTGAQVCKIGSGVGVYSYGLGIDENGNAYGIGTDWDYDWPWYWQTLYGWKPDGTAASHPDYDLQCGSRDCVFDYTMDRVISVGAWATKAPGEDQRQISACNISDGIDVVYYQTSTSSGDKLIDVETDGTYIYSCGYRTAAGVGGAYATTYKFDSDLNLLASYDTGGSFASALWFDWNGNLVVKDPGVDKFFILDPADFSLIASYDWTDSGPDVGWGCEGLAVPFTPGTPGVPASWSYTTYGDKDAIRLLPWEHSTNDAYVLEFGHSYIGFLRTTE